MKDKFKIAIVAVIAAIIMALAAAACCLDLKYQEAKAEAARLAANQTTLLSEIDTARAENGRLMATVDALSLRRDELERLLPAQAAEIRNLRLRLKDVQAVAALQTETAFQADLDRDTVFVEVFKEAAPEGRRSYRFRDVWVDALVTVVGDSARLDMSLRDSLTVVAHKERRKCIFKKPKITSLTVSPASPYTKVTGVGYVEVVD